MRELKPEAPVVIFDIDGTLADSEHRLHYIKPTEPGQKKDWYRFFKESIFDKPIFHVRYLMSILQREERLNLVIITGRPESQRALTEQWLNKVWCRWEALYMRPDDDRRPDYEVKLDIIKEKLAGHDILLAFEDRLAVAAALEKAGIPTLITNSDWKNKGFDEPEKHPLDNDEFKIQSQIALKRINDEHL